MKSTRLYVASIILVLLSLGSRADARPRDDVMSAAFRCGVIGDSRKWLDCIYGSAQPIRAELGLPPVTQTQAQLVQAPPAGGQIANRATRDAVLSDAVRCDAIAADRQWLDCFYAAANTMRSELGLTSAPETHAVQIPAIASNKGTAAIAGAPAAANGNRFGLPEIPRTSSRIVSRLSSYTFDRYGIFTVTLSNGQIWRQVTGDTSFAHWKQTAASYVVAITKGALGSYNLRVQNGPGLFKVERLS